MSNEFDTDRPESAFPSTFRSLDTRAQQIHRWGMTLRDYFAAKATEEDIKAHREGSMEEHIAVDGTGRKYITHRNTRYTREQAKYRYADAMLKARGSSNA